MGHAFRMLVIDDNPGDGAWIAHEMLKEFSGLEVERVGNEQDLRRALETGGFDLVVIEGQVRWGSTLEAISAAKSQMPHSTVLVCTDPADTEFPQEALRHGADGYLLKTEKTRQCLGSAVRAMLERARLHQRLSECDKDIHNFICASPVAMALADLHGHVSYVNDTFTKTFGYDLRDVRDLQQWWRSVCPEAVPHETYCPLTGGDARGACRCRITCKDGSVRQVEASRIVSGSKLLIVLNDTAAPDQADEKLLHLAAIVQSTDDAIVSADVEGIITSWNRGAERIFGYSRNEMVGKSNLVLVPPGQEEEMRQVLERVRRGEHIEHLETRRVCKDGTLIYMSFTIAPIIDEGGNVTSISVIGSDITYRKTLELQLRQSQKMEALGTLSGGIAHDFNNILTAILGNATMLAMKMDPNDPLTSNVHQIQEAAGRAANLTQSLLAFSRKKPIETKAVDLNSIVDKVETLLRQLMREDIDFKCAIGADELTIMADPGQIEQVLMNLATNARDALPNGGIIRISTFPVLLDREFIRVHGYGRPGRYASITVSDNGAGMEPATRQRIFEPFFTTKEIGRGTGLGLSIVYGIIKQHGGYINCYSEAGEGTTFQIFLPLTGVAAEEQGVVREMPICVGTETILLAEDDAGTRRINRELLENFGYKVIEAEDGEEAVAKFRQHAGRIKLLFFDAIMPKKNGREAYLEIVREAPEVKVLFTSGYAADIFDEKEKLATNFIPKPILPTVLLKRIREILDGSQK